MNRIQGRSRKWIALAGVLVVAAVAWFTMKGDGRDAAQVGWFVLDAQKIRLGTVLIILSFGLRILLMDRFAKSAMAGTKDADDAAALDAASAADVKK